LISLNVTQANPTVNAAFFQPIAGLASQSSHARACPDFSDDDYLQCGLLRVLESSTSGRAFLQEHGARLNNSPSQANYFATLHSPRRGAVVADVNNDLRIMANQTLPDRLAGMAELAAYEVFAVDGHWHKAATHDPRHNGVKMSVGHFYSLNLRTHTLRQLAVGEGAHEHDLSGSPLFSVELELGQAKLAGGEVKHGDEVGGGTIAPGFAFGGAEDAV